MENRELTRVDHVEPLVVDVMVAIDAVKDLIDPKGTQCMYFLLAGIANSLLIAFALSGATRCFLVPEVLSSRVHNPLLCLPLIKIPQEYLKLPETVVVQNLLMCGILFYTVYYLSLSMCCLTLKVWELDVLAPFDFKTHPSWLNTNYKILLVSTEVTYFVCGLLFAQIVEEWVWDYAISVTILHVIITSAVTLEFPLTSHWWAALGTGMACVDPLMSKNNVK
ncbi:transmembrane protein 244 [Cricetulus griseus]|uniref:transmembrane protein 244 n=1 Tax=Cricetulus griseus TaxID=10029 RepID=UPI0004544885|nr:transmembrane protein 244 [Cricetulus griseus]